MNSISEKQCDERHDRIEKTMTELQLMQQAHERRITIMETIAEKSDQLRWKLLTPFLAFCGSVSAGLILAYWLRN